MAVTTAGRISKIEQRVAAAIWLFLFLFFASPFLTDFVRRYNQRVADEQLQMQHKANNDGRIVANVNVTRGSPVPAGLHLISLLIFLSLVSPKRFYVCTALTILYGWLILASIYFRVDGQAPLGFLGELFIKVQIWDVAGIAFTLGMLMWLTTVHLRLRTDLQ